MMVLMKTVVKINTPFVYCCRLMEEGLLLEKPNLKTETKGIAEVFLNPCAIGLT